MRARASRPGAAVGRNYSRAVPGDPDEREAWRERRREAADAHAAAAERAWAREHGRARELLVGFVAELRRRGVAPVPLEARAGGARLRTDLSGWYLKRDRSLAVTPEGDYYVLAVALDLPSRLRARLRGVHLEPTDPPLQVGRGARDGESVELVELLRMRLAEVAEGPGR
ncbi:hypothetical protein NUM3379_37980 [Kineococcus sp. NUM-3379]